MYSVKRVTKSPLMLVAVVALVAALAGTAVADQTASTSALTKKKVKKIATKQINKLAPGLSVASADRADTANSANTANTANSANNADTVDGKHASAFAAASEAHTPGRFVVNDAIPGDNGSSLRNLLSAGQFQFRGECTRNAGGGTNDVADVFLQGPNGTSFAIGEPGGSVFNNESLSGRNMAIASSSANIVRSAHFIAVAPNGQVVAGTASSEINDPAGHCVFGLSVNGP